MKFKLDSDIKPEEVVHKSRIFVLFFVNQW